MNNFDWDNSFLVDFDLVTGLSNAAAPSERRLSKMKDMFTTRTRQRKSWR